MVPYLWVQGLSHFSYVRLLTLCDPMDCSPLRLLHPWDPPGKNTEVGFHALLQGIFPNQGSNPRRLHLLLWQAGSLTSLPLKCNILPV